MILAGASIIRTTAHGNQRRLPDLVWLRAHLHRTGKAEGVDISTDIALVRFAREMPTKKWERISQTWETRRYAHDLATWARRHLRGTAVPLLREMNKRLEKENRVLRKRLAKYESEMGEQDAA